MTKLAYVIWIAAAIVAFLCLAPIFYYGINNSGSWFAIGSAAMMTMVVTSVFIRANDN